MTATQKMELCDMDRMEDDQVASIKRVRNSVLNVRVQSLQRDIIFHWETRF